jgi:hypothetical protein
MPLIGDFGGNAMKTVIFNSENAAFKFDKKKVKERIICKQSEYDPNEITQLLETFSTTASETLLNSDDHHYFGYVALDLIGSCIGTVTCQICGKSYDSGQLKEFAIGHGKSPFDIKQEQKGGIRLFEKRKMPSRFGGKGYKCPEGHKLISMETWKT